MAMMPLRGQSELALKICRDAGIPTERIRDVALDLAFESVPMLRVSLLLSDAQCRAMAGLLPAPVVVVLREGEEMPHG